MSGTVGIPSTPSTTPGEPRSGNVRLVPMKIGEAEVFIEAVGDSPTLEARPGFREVGLDPTEAFEKASDALRECVRIVGDRLTRPVKGTGPAEVGVEFTITFDVEGQAKIVPVLLTGKAKTSMGVKVTAVWRRGGMSEDNAGR